jgi:predicted MFS family arabinose efflux permease
MQQVAMGWLLLEITQPETRALWLGVVAATGAVPGLVFSLIAGAVADRVRKRDLIVVTQCCAMALAFVLAAITHAELASIPLVIGIAFLSGTVNAFDAPTRQSFVIEMVGREDLPHAIALNSAIFNSARMLGPAVGGWVIAALGLASAFLLNGVSFIAVVVGLLLMRLPPRQATERRGSEGSLRDGLRYIRGNRFVLALLTQSAILNVFAASYATLLPMYARDLMGAEVGDYGHLVSLIGIGAILGAFTLSATGGARPSLLLCGAGVLCAAIAGISFAPNLTVAMCIMPAIGWGMMINMASTNTLIQFSVPDEMRGRAISAYTLTFMGMAPLGGLQAGAVAQALGVPVTLRIGAAISACAVLLLARRVLRGGRGAA